MAAKLATVDDRILAGAEDACCILDARMVPRVSSDKPKVCGTHFDCGYLSPFFITDPERMEVAFEDACILISEGKISCKKDLLPLLEQITKIGKPLLIIAEDVEGEALATLVVNKLRGPLQVAAVRAPGFGEQRNHMLREIALVTGAKTIGEGIDLQLRNVQVSDLGLARKITVDKNHTVVEGRTKDRRLSFEPESCAQASVYTLPAQSV
jgi:chaperonin GroEL